MLLAAVSVVVGEDGVGDVAVRDNLNGAVVAEKLLLGEDVGVVAVHTAVDADDGIHQRGDCAHIVRNNHHSHLGAQLLGEGVELLLEGVVNEVRRLVENEEFWLGDDGSAEQGALQLATRHLAYGARGNILDAHPLQQGLRALLVLCRVARKEALFDLQTRQNDFLDGDWETCVKLAHLRHITYLEVLATAQGGRVPNLAAMLYDAQYALGERGLAAAVWTYDADEVVGVDVEVDTLERGRGVVVDRDIAERNYGVM